MTVLHWDITSDTALKTIESYLHWDIPSDIALDIIENYLFVFKLKHCLDITSDIALVINES